MNIEERDEVISKLAGTMLMSEDPLIFVLRIVWLLCEHVSPAQFDFVIEAAKNVQSMRPSVDRPQ